MALTEIDHYVWRTHFDMPIIREPRGLLKTEQYLDEGMKELDHPGLLQSMDPKPWIRRARVWWLTRRIRFHPARVWWRPQCYDEKGDNDD